MPVFLAVCSVIGTLFSGMSLPSVSADASAASWRIALERVDEVNGRRSAPVVISGSGCCDGVRLGTNAWMISVKPSFESVEGGVSGRLTIRNRETNWRVIGMAGPCFCVAGADPERFSVYVPDGLGRRVNPLAASLDKLEPQTAYKPEFWCQDPRWMRTDSGGLFLGTGWYPGSWGMTMAYIALSDGKRGVYFGRHDPSETVMRMEVVRPAGSRVLKMSPVHRAAVSPGESWSSPESVCRAFAGDWHAAAKIYRSWHDTVRKPIKPPAWLVDRTGWLLVIMRQQNGEVFWKYGDMDKLCDYADLAGLNMIGLFGWTEGGHDHLYPDYKASDEMGGVEGLKRAIELAHRRGMRICIYANGQLQQVDGTDFWRTDGSRIALEDRNGDRHIQHYPKYKNIPKYDFALGCLHAPAWRGRMTWLAHQARSFGADAILYDQLGCTRPWFCYGAGHGHPVPANSYEKERPGFIRDILDGMRREAPDFAVLTEGLHDTVLDSIGCFHGCEMGCFQVRLSWDKKAPSGADAWTRRMVYAPDARFADPAPRSDIFPELYRYTFPETLSTVRVPNPIADRSMVNWTLLFGLRHDVELRYAPDRAYAVEGRMPEKKDYALVCSPPDIARLQRCDRTETLAWMKAANDFQREHADLLLRGRFVDDEDVRLETDGKVLAKRFLSPEGGSGVVVWNMGENPASVALTVGNSAFSGAYEPRVGKVDGGAALPPNALRLFRFR